MMNQRTAVFNAVCTVLGYQPTQPVLSFMDKDQIKAVQEVVLAEFRAGNVELKGERTDEWLVKYVPGLVNNWMRKDMGLNGNTEYVAKNPGSRTGSGDESLKAMKALLASLPADHSAVPTIKAAIEEKVVQLAEAKKPVINVDALPEQFRGLVIRKAADTK